MGLQTLLGTAALALLAALLPACKKKNDGHNPASAPPAVPVQARSKPPLTAPGGPGSAAPVEAPQPAAAPATPGAPAPPEVKVSKPLKQDVEIFTDYTGQLVGSQDLDVIARVEAVLVKSHLAEGTLVKAGDLLFELDPSTYQAIVDQAKGALAVAVALREKSTADVNRNRPLIEKNAISREEYETSLAADKASLAQVEAARGAVDRAMITLGYTKIYAPASGLAGKLEISVGNVAGRPGTTVLTKLSVIDPIHAQIRVPESDILRYHSKRAKGTKRVLRLFLSDGSPYPEPGEVAIVDRSIDPRTGTLLVEVSFPNPDQSLRPGFFARVRAVADRLPGALLVPQRAVEELQGSYRITVVGPDGTAQVKPVKVGPRSGNLWVITEGLEPGEFVVVEGRNRARSGAKVTAVEVPIEPEPVSAPAPAAGSDQ